MKGKLIGLVGKKGIGKDTMADIMISLQENMTKISIAEPLKKIVVELFQLDWSHVNDYEKKEIIIPRWDKTPRQLLQWIGTDIMRNHVRDDIWTLHLYNRIINIRNMMPDMNIIVTDIRFLNEAIVVRELGGILIRIESICHYSFDLHQSETEQDNIKVDFILNNDKTKGIDFFRETIIQLFKKIDYL